MSESMQAYFVQLGLAVHGQIKTWGTPREAVEYLDGWAAFERSHGYLRMAQFLTAIADVVRQQIPGVERKPLEESHAQ